MIQTFLIIVAIFIFLTVLQTIWNTLVFQHPKVNWVLFMIWVVIDVLLVGGLIFLIKKLDTVPIINVIVGFINKIFSMFFGYLAPFGWGISLWFLLVPLVAFFYFTIRGIRYYFGEKRNYRVSMARRKKAEQEKLNKEAELLKKNKEKKTENESGIETEKKHKKINEALVTD